MSHGKQAVLPPSVKQRDFAKLYILSMVSNSSYYSHYMLWVAEWETSWKQWFFAGVFIFRWTESLRPIRSPPISMVCAIVCALRGRRSSVWLKCTSMQATLLFSLVGIGDLEPCHVTPRCIRVGRRGPWPYHRPGKRRLMLLLVVVLLLLLLLLLLLRLLRDRDCYSTDLVIIYTAASKNVDLRSLRKRDAEIKRKKEESEQRKIYFLKLFFQENLIPLLNLNVISRGLLSFSKRSH